MKAKVLLIYILHTDVIVNKTMNIPEVQLTFTRL
nr:MAG TPA: hypothetical protein [Caudoviricetes sp.]